MRFPYQAVRNVDCFIKLEAPPGHRIQITFPTIYFDHNICVNLDQGLFVHDGGTDASPVIGRFCDSSRKGALNFKKSKSNALFLKYKSGEVPMAFKAVYQFGMKVYKYRIFSKI